MKSVELLALGLRLLGFYGVIKTMEYIGISYKYSYSMPAENAAFWYVVYGATIALMLLASLFLIKFPVIVARKLLPKTNQDDVTLKGTPEDIQITAFIILGVYILSGAIPDFIYNASMLIYMHESYVEENLIGEYLITEIMTGIEVGIGVYLCVQAKGLQSLLFKLRNNA